MYLDISLTEIKICEILTKRFTHCLEYLKWFIEYGVKLAKYLYGKTTIECRSFCVST